MAGELLWKAVNRDWTSRRGVRWDIGSTVVHPTSTAMTRDNPVTYLSLADTPEETLIGRDWPCRLLRVEPVGKVLDSDTWPHKRCVLTAQVVAEVEPWRALGPNGRGAAAVIDRCGRLTDIEVRRLNASAAASAAARVAARAAASAAFRAAARAAVVADRVTAADAAGDAAWFAASVVDGSAAWDAAEAVVVADLIAAEQYAILAGPLASVVGPLDELPVPAWVDEPAADGGGAQ